MLKIKSDVNLDEVLPKYGFKKKDLGRFGYYYLKRTNNLSGSTYVNVYKDSTVHIDCYSSKKIEDEDGIKTEVDILYNMIADGIVERINDVN